MELNGASQEARFSFEAFRFVEHNGQRISTFYLHCVTRLCEVSACSQLLPVSERSPSATFTTANMHSGFFSQQPDCCYFHPEL